MIIQTINVNNCQPQTIVIGRRGTYNTLQIAFDLSYLVESYGNGVAVLAVKRSQDESAYPAVTTQADNTLTWTVSETDTAYVGAGECQLMWYVDGGLAKTIIYPMAVMRDILATSEEAPDAYQTWVDDLTALGAETLQNAQNAEQSASDAETAKDDAVTAKEAAEEAATKAEAAVVHAPIIQNGFWYIWSDDQYVNTNVRAEGKKGDKGDTGEKGDTGNGISGIELLSTSGLQKTYRINMTNETHFDFVVTDGNGISGASFDAETNELTITFDNGTSFTTPSLKGAPGDPGDDGYSPAVTIDTITGGHRVTITDKTHPTGQSFDVLDGSNDAGNVSYDATATYQSGTVGAELQEQNRHLSDLGLSVVNGKLNMTYTEE